MINNMNWWNLLSYIVPIISIFLSNYLGRRYTEKANIRKEMMNRYETAYVPFLKKLYAGHMFSDELLKSGAISSKGIFFNLISQNLHLYGLSVVRVYPRLYDAFLDLLEFENGNLKYHSAVSEYQNVFSEITTWILLEASMLESELKLPGLAQSFQIIRVEYEQTGKYTKR